MFEADHSVEARRRRPPLAFAGQLFLHLKHIRLKRIPDCWRKERKLEPVVGSAGGWVMRGLRAIVAGAGGLVPGVPVDGITERMGRYIEPRPALVYAVPDGCDFSL